MLIKSKHFGEVEIDDNNIIEFPEGIFGFENSEKFVVLYNNTEGKNTFCWLQSLENETIALPMIDPTIFFKDYDPEVAGNSIAKIGELKEEDLKLYTVVVVPEKIEKMTTNLKAPIIINVVTKLGIQVVVEDDKYELKQNLYEQIQSLKKEGE